MNGCDVPDPHDVGTLCIEAYVVDASEWRGGACNAPASFSLYHVVSLNDCGSKRLSAWVCEPFARREIMDTVCQGKGEDAARAVHERIRNGCSDNDVHERQRIATILYPASVIPLIPAPAGRQFDAH